jgi:cell division protein FtsB
MRIFKYLLGVWTAVAVYTALSFFWGPNGLSAYNYLLSEKEHQLANIKNLEIINEELEKTKNNLLYDNDTLLVHAHQMGYGYEDERFVRIVGLGNVKNSTAVTGEVYFAYKPEFIADKYIKIAALCAGFLVFAFLFVLEFFEAKF